MYDICVLFLLHATHPRCNISKTKGTAHRSPTSPENSPALKSHCKPQVLHLNCYFKEDYSWTNILYIYKHYCIYIITYITYTYTHYVYNMYTLYNIQKIEII